MSSVTNESSFEPSRGEGPVGTGVHVLRRTPGPDGTTTGDVWLTLLFVPVVPFGEWTLERGGAAGSAWRVMQVVRPRLARSAAWVAAGIGALVVSLLPAYVAIVFFMGSKPVELGGLFSSAGAIVGALGWLDQTRERVPLRAAARLLIRRAKSPAGGS